MAGKVLMVCGVCQSKNVRADAYASWDVGSQSWELDTTFDKGAVCDDCGGETTIKEVPAAEANQED